MRTRIALVLVTVASVAHVLIGQQSSDTAPPPQPRGTPPVFRSSVESVRLDAIVTDKQGNPITDLVADDFVVRESETLQTIRQFTRVFLPVSSAANRSGLALREPGPIPDVSANDKDQERIYVIVLGHLAWAEAVRATKMVRRFLDAYFDDNDLAAVVTLDRNGPMRFTNDRAFLMNEANAFVSRFADTPAWPSSVGFGRQFGTFSGGAFGPRNAGSIEVFAEIARALGHVEARRKSILFISRSIGFDPYDAIDMPRSSFSENARAAMDPIMAGNLTVYPLYPGVAEPMSKMRALAYVTGAVPAGSDYNRVFKQIVRDSSMYYVLGYDSTNQRRDGGYRRIKIEVKRRGLKVRARDGYFVEFPEDRNPDRLISWNGRSTPLRPLTFKTDMNEALSKAMASPVALTSVPLKVFVAPHMARSRSGSVTVVVEIAPSGLDLMRDDDTVTGRVDVAIGATSGTRTLRGTAYTYDVSVQGDRRRQLERNGLRILSEIQLDPGQYQLHVAAGARGGRIGKVLYDLTVPDFTRGLLAMSGVSIMSEAGADVPTLQSKSVRTTALPGPPSASREFTRDDTLVMYAEVYENVWWTDSDHTISLKADLRAEDGRVVHTASEQRSSKAPPLADGGHGFLVSVPLSKVPSGSYVVRLEARSDFGEKPSVTREIPIRVR